MRARDKPTPRQRVLAWCRERRLLPAPVAEAVALLRLAHSPHLRKLRGRAAWWIPDRDHKPTNGY